MIEKFLAHLNIPPAVYGVILSMLMTVLRIIYDKEETKLFRIFIESLLCGALSLTAYHMVLAMGIDMNWAVFAGGVIGYVGPATVRAKLMDSINEKINNIK